MTEKSTFGSAAYGGAGWSPRTRPLRQEIGDLWTACGVDNEWPRLRAVLLPSPGDDLRASAGDAYAVQIRSPVAPA